MTPPPRLDHADAFIVGAAVVALGVLWRGMDLLARAYTSPTTAPAMWLMTGVGLAGAIAVAVIFAIAHQDGVQLGLHDRSLTIGGRMPRTVDTTARTLPPASLDDARSAQHYAQAELAAARAAQLRTRAPEQGPTRLASNGFSGVDFEDLETLWKREES